MQLFIAGNQGGKDTTVLSKLDIFGSGKGGSTNMKDFKRVAGEKGETE